MTELMSNIYICTAHVHEYFNFLRILRNILEWNIQSVKVKNLPQKLN